MANRRLSALIVLIGGASYGIQSSFVKLGFISGFSVGEMVGGQFLIGMLFLWILTFIKLKKRVVISRKTALSLIMAGSLSGMTGIFYFAAMSKIPVSIAIVLLFQFTWVGPLYGWIFQRQKPHNRTYVVLAVILIGTLFAANVVSGQFHALDPLGVLYGLLSAFGFAGFIYVSGNVATEVNPWLRSSLMITGSFIVIGIIFPPTFLISGALLSGLWKYVIPSALLGAVLPPICFAMGTPQLKSGIATILSSIELPVAVIMAWIILHEKILLLQWLGIFLIFGAIIMSEYETIKGGKTQLSD